MQPMNSRQLPPCRFGPTCRNLAQGSCRFSHSNTNQGQNNNNQNNNPKFGGNRGSNYPPQNYGMNNQQNMNQGGKGWGNQQGHYGKTFNEGGKSFNQGPKSNPHYVNQNLAPKSADQFTSKFCMSYQYNQPCKYEQRGKCIRIHGFDINDKIRRVAFDASIPPQQPSKLGKFVKEGQTYLILRMGNSITLLTFNNETSGFNILQSWKFPKPELKYSYYGQKQNFVYISAQNPKSTLHDIWIYDILTGGIIVIEQAHSSPVTDVIHFNNQILLSSSKDGYIKVWKIEGNNALIDQQSSKRLFDTYSSGKTTQILFLDLSVVSGLKILSAGTNDNRVLFFLGEQMNFKPLILSERHALVYKIRYCTINEAPYAFVLSWTRDSSSSSIVVVPLSQLTYNQFLAVDAKQSPRNNISLIEVIQNRLFVANLSGNVTIYSLPSMQKQGALLHKNSVNSIVPAQYITKTQIVIPQIFVLESKYLQKSGSLGAYNIKK